MRVGHNPLTAKEAPAHFPPVLLAVVTHLPNDAGYHKERFEIVRTCLESMRAGLANIPLLIWDNGSGGEFREYLDRKLENTDYLFLSPNIGKGAARAAILKMLPPETIVALSDDDMLFEAGWLDAHLQLLNKFPNVGVVSGFPHRYAFDWGINSTLAWAASNANLEKGRFLPDEWESDYAYSIGSTPERILARFAMRQDYRITYKGTQAWAQASHCQFVCKAGVIAPLCKYEKVAIGDERPFDEAIDKAGLLRLTTIKRTVRHMGNVKGDK